MGGITRTILSSIRNSSLIKGAGDGKASNDIQERKKVVKLLVAMFCVFLMTWGPQITQTFLYQIGVISRLFPYYLEMVNITQVIAYGNCCVNPILYALVSKQFKTAFWRAMTGRHTNIKSSTSSGSTAISSIAKSET